MLLYAEKLTAHMPAIKCTACKRTMKAFVCDHDAHLEFPARSDYKGAREEVYVTYYCDECDGRPECQNSLCAWSPDFSAVSTIPEIDWKDFN